MDIRFYNAKILQTGEDQTFHIIEGELWVEGNSITYIGKSLKNEKAWDREVDVAGNLLMPGFKNPIHILR